MNKNKRIEIEHHNPEAIILEDLDNAIIGISHCGKVIYNIDLIHQELKNNGMPEEDIDEYIDFNILYAHLGEYSPIYIYSL